MTLKILMKNIFRIFKCKVNFSDVEMKKTILDFYSIFLETIYHLEKEKYNPR